MTIPPKVKEYIDKIHEHHGYMELIHTRNAIRLAFLEGQKDVIRMAEKYSNDAELGEEIRRLYWYAREKDQKDKLDTSGAE